MGELHRACGPELSAGQLYALLRLRMDVFIVEQGCAYPELDGADLLATTQHFWIGEGPQLGGCLRVLGETTPVSIGRVCTSTGMRGRGLGALLMAAAVEELGGAELALHAQAYAVDFYARFGFVVAGTPYLEDGIEHVRMRRAAVRNP